MTRRAVTVAKLLLVIVALSLLGCTGEKPTKEGVQTTSQATNELKLKIGETAKTSVLEITVSEVFKTDVIGGKYGNYWAEEGKVLVFAKVTAKNINTKSRTWYLGPLSFSASDEKGRRFDVKPMSVDGYLEGGELYPGEYREGYIAFEVPKDVQKIRIKYDFGGLLEVKLATWEAEMSDVPTKSPNVVIRGGDLSYEPSMGGYIVKAVVIDVQNAGNLPIRLGELEIKYGNEPWEIAGYEDVKLNPGTSKTIEINAFKYLERNPEQMTVKVRFVDRTPEGEEKVIAEGAI